MVRELEQEVRLVVGVEKEVDKLKSNLTAIQAVLTDAETRQVKEITVRDWLEKLKEVAYDIEDMLDFYEAAIPSSQSKPGDEQVDPKHERKVCSFLRSSCFCCKQVGLRHDIASKIKEVNDRLDLLAQEKERYKFVPTEANPLIERPMTISKIDITEVKGRDQDKNVLVKMLLSEPTPIKYAVGDRPDLPIFSLVGMGGIGKTTLAQFAFNHNSTEAYFDKKIWVCVSHPFDEIRVAKAIIASLLGSTPAVIELEDLIQKIGESIKGKKILLILDDVWEENPTKWDQLKQSLSYGSPGSKVLVTTRKETVASVMGCSKDNILKVGTLSDEECWSIISKIAFFDRSDTTCKRLEEIGRKISSKCRGLPLAAKAMGGILRFRQTREEWESISNNEIWEVEEAQRDVIAPLWLSYYDLSPALKRCFSYCAIFPKDYDIKRSELIELWMAQGFLKQGQRHDLEMVGEYYFRNLVMRSLFQDFKNDQYDDQRIYSCKMHDIVHDFAQIIAQNECLGVQINGPVDTIIRSLSSKVRHLHLDLAKHNSSINSFDYIKKLRSIFIWGSPYGTPALSRLFSELKHVRSLSLRYGEFAEIPSSICKLVRLRWLDLSYNEELRQLPETLFELHDLQTIDITECSNLELLPEIGKIISLKHLRNYVDNEGPSRLPKGIAELTGLRTMEGVDFGYDGDDAFSLCDLKNLNQLRGSLILKNLGAYNHHAGEAKEAELKKKVHVTCLGLFFTLEPHTAGHEELLEGLEPSPNLEILSVDFYGGTTLSSWMISLKNLRNIKLSRCQSCEQLPSLGMLPSLETLTLEDLLGVEKVGKELLGIGTQIGDSKSEASSSASSSSSSSPVVVAFPKLTKIVFQSLYCWKEWDDYYSDDHDGTAKPPSAMIIMPSLHSLTFDFCPKLKALPDYILQNAMLHTLEIKISDLLKERYNKKKGEDWSKISHISHVIIS